MFTERLFHIANATILLLLLPANLVLQIGAIDPPSELTSYHSLEMELVETWSSAQPIPVRIGFYENPPKIFTDTDGNIAGFWPELIAYIAAEEGWQIVWVPGTWEEGLERLENNQIDIMPDVAWSASRSQLYAFSTEKVLISWTRLYARSGVEIENILDLEGMTIAGLGGSINMEGPEGIKDITNRFGVQSTFVDMNTYTEMFEALERGEIDAGITNKDFGNLHERNYKINRTSLIFQPAHIEFAYPKNGEMTPFLLERIDAHILALKTGDNSIYYQLLEEYLEQKTAVTIVEIIPNWVKVLLMLGGGAILFLLAVGITSRIQVSKRTTELHKSEENYRNLFELATDGIFIANHIGQYLDVNQRGCIMLGYTREELLTMNISDLVDPENIATMPLRLDELLAGKTLMSERLLICKDGRRLPVEINSRLMPDGTLQGIVRDITERKRAESEREYLAMQNQAQAWQLESILETVPTGVLLLDANGIVLQANSHAEESLLLLAGVKVGEKLTGLGNKTLAELLTLPSTKGLFHEVKTSQQIYEVIAHPVKTGSASGYWVLVVADVTREREIRNQLQQQERVAALGQLAAGIAHDFNNIMATIILYSQLLTRSENLTMREMKQVETINQQSWHASRLIEQILDFSRQAVLELRPIDLLPLLKEHVKLLRRTLPEHIEVEIIHEMDEYTVNADPTRMQQIVTNLAVNARDALPTGGQLRISLEKITVDVNQLPSLPGVGTGNWVKLSVVDNGEGIAPDTMPHIFEPFFTTKGPGEGSGLGLAQVYGIVAQHGGYINVESQNGVGTIFSIFLTALEITPVEPLSINAANFLRGRGELVLIVEDEHTLRAALLVSMKEWNYRVIEASNGREALEKMAEHGDEISLILSDVVMPEMGGEALFYTLRKRGWQTPIVLLTGHPMDKKLDKLKADGVAAWLTKPPNLEYLTTTLANILHSD
jgi:two-component system, cell cycle sensor histidine kinase and response regulator CckA